LQLDVYGELIDAFYQSRLADLKLDEGSWALARTIVEHVGDVWDQPDHGIWEIRGERKHYVFSKVMTWVAIDRAIKGAERFGYDAPFDRWRGLRDTIHRDVCEKGFDIGQNTFVECYGSTLLDASILLLPSVGFLPASDPRVRGTLVAIERYMMRDGFVLRHDPRKISDEIQPIEGAFLACSLWLADAFVLAGEIDKAQTLFDRVAAVANDLGLLAEEFDSGAGRQTGNFPQALTHIALINTAHNLSEARHADDKPAMQRSK
jgi:GH15 family glucan-1,4-alpha-glucosidase